jgi:N-acylneuraminate cytidylyltransferase
MSIAIIPARGNSQRIPRKNIKEFCGIPIIEYSIETAIKSELFDAVVVSTDDKEIGEISMAAGATVIYRPPCDGSMGTQEVARLVLHQVANPMPAACVIYATAPLLLPSDLHDGLKALRLPGHEFAMSVRESPLSDAGAYYWGWSDAFMHGLPLIAPHTAMCPLPAERVCDINTLADWSAATYLYHAMMRKSMKLDGSD